jgi:class 3 adenylate cyclase/tetratricopeptide (TPR) repeat protein
MVGTGTCAQCGAEHAPGSRFCSICGAALWRDCAVCGNDQPVSAAFCSACGAALGNGARRAQPAKTGEERRVVTVLFADLSGSTTLGERLDPEDVRAVQGELFSLVDDEVQRHGGVTEKFAGDAVMAVFGVPQAHEDDAERAVRAGLAAQERFGELARRIGEDHGLDVGLRIGVATGEVVSGRDAAARGELMVSGDAVNVAARLQQHAESGTVTVGERAHREAQRGIRFRRIASVDAKGKSAPLAAWVAEAAADRPSRRGVEGLAAPIIGRDDELALLATLAARVENDRAPQLVTIYGQAGVGKSRLLAEFVDRLDDVRLLKGRCLPYGDGITYWPLAEVAKSHAGVLDTDPAEQALAKLRAAVEHVVPAERAGTAFEAAAWTVGLTLPGRTAVWRSDDTRDLLRRGWADYLAGLGREQFTVLAVEDVHWASQPLLDLLDQVTEDLHETSLMVVCPSRPELLEHRPGWGAGRLNATAITLQPLPPERSRELVAALLEADQLPEQLRAGILDRAEGNPFFLEEVVRMLIDRGALTRSDGTWTADARIAELPIPDSVLGVIAARIDLLDAGSRTALRRCAVVGRVFWAEAVGVDPRLIEELSRCGLVHELPSTSIAGSREFRFKHALTRDVAYGTLTRDERRAMHRQVADWICAVAPDRATEKAELTAYHYLQAVALGDPDVELARLASAQLSSAGDGTLAQGAVETAREHFERAFEVAPDDRSRGVAELGLARVTSGYGPAARARLDSAVATFERLGDPLLLAEALSWKSRADWLAGHWDDAFVAADRAVAVQEGLPASPQLARALGRRAQLQMLRGMPVALQSADETIAVARQVGDILAEANARVTRFATNVPGAEGLSAAELRETIDLSIQAGAFDEACRAIVNYLWVAVEWAPVPEVEAAVDGAMGMLQGFLPKETYGAYLTLSRARLLCQPSGRWDEVHRLVDSVPESVDVNTRLLALDVEAGEAMRLGDLERTDHRLDRFRELAMRSREPQRIIPMLALDIPRTVMRGDVARVRELGMLALSMFPWQMPIAPVSILRGLEAVGAADLLAEAFTTFGVPPTRFCSGRVLPPAAAGLGALAEGRPADAVAPLTALRDAQAWHGFAFEAALSELDLARAFERSGDPAGAAAARARADEVLVPLGVVNPI